MTDIKILIMSHTNHLNGNAPTHLLIKIEIVNVPSNLKLLPPPAVVPFCISPAACCVEWTEAVPAFSVLIEDP